MFKRLRKMRSTALIVAICAFLAGSLATALKDEQADNLYDGYLSSSLSDEYDRYDDDYDSYETPGISPEFAVAAYSLASYVCIAVCAIAAGVWGVSMIAIAFGEDMADAVNGSPSATDGHADASSAAASPAPGDTDEPRPQGARFK